MLDRCTRLMKLPKPSTQKFHSCPWPKQGKVLDEMKSKCGLVWLKCAALCGACPAVSVVLWLLCSVWNPTVGVIMWWSLTVGKCLLSILPMGIKLLQAFLVVLIIPYFQACCWLYALSHFPSHCCIPGTAEVWSQDKCSVSVYRESLVSEEG